jgi:2-oxo-3-hexenedioate decarboxylase
MNTHEIATEIFSALGRGVQVAPFSSRFGGFDLETAYRVAAEVHAMRIARGERPLGRKIGFTNRTIWAEYGVWAPIWGYIYDRTVTDIATGGEAFSLAGLTEPRIEPEIVFGIAAAPAPGMDEAALLGCMGWVAHGFEIVQSIYPGWKFAASDTVAAYGLHGALMIGPRHEVAPRRDEWRATLGSFEIDLVRDGALADRGRAANVLDGPVPALRHLVELLARDPIQPPLAAGEIVTTGTLTRAMPVGSGQSWSTVLRGVGLDGIRVRFA